MKRRFIGVALATILLVMMVPFGGALSAEEEFTAWFGAQMADPINGWELGEVAEAKFKLNEEATISIDFGEKVSFGDGNYIAIETNVPNPFTGMDMFQNPVLAQILSFKLDGKDVEMADAFLNAEGKDAIDGSGKGLRLTLTNKWSALEDDEQPVDPTTLGEFEKLEISFIVRGVYFAQFGAQMADPVNGWGLGDMAATGFSMGHPAVIEFEFDELVSFGDGNYIAIETNLPNPFEGEIPFANSEMAQILSFKLDDKEVDMGDVLLNAEGMDAIDGSSPGLRLTLTNKWNGDIDEQPVDAETLGEFKKLRIEFIVNYVGDPPEPPKVEVPDLSDVTGIAYIGGTFVFLDRAHPDDADPENDPGRCDWWAFEDQAVEIKVGVPFTVSIDMGSEKIRHDLAHWNGEDYIIAVDTDIDLNPVFFGAYIDSIKKDGVDIPFDPDNVTVGRERGNLRISITNSWAEVAGDPVPIAGPFSIGEFSKFEVTMVIVEDGDPDPFREGGGEDEPVVTPPPPIERPTEDPKSDGLPGWFLPVAIGGGVLLVGVVVFAVIKGKKKA
ncbi:MAG: hypothetical protein FWD44_01375 [Oscillospiraceae bacterium]|nr:hypothetical protein [Oscillospiraceae bacterium]